MPAFRFGRIILAAVLVAFGAQGHSTAVEPQSRECQTPRSAQHLAINVLSISWCELVVSGQRRPQRNGLPTISD